MLKVLWNLVGRVGGVAENVQPAGPAIFEPLEPRLLLNADLAGAQPLPSELASTDYAVHVDLSRQDDSPQVDVTSVLTLSLETDGGTPDVCGQAGPANTDSAVTSDLSQAVGDRVEYGVIASAQTSGSSVSFQNEQAGPATPDQQDIALSSETPSIEIRGPPSPSCDSVNPLYETTYGDQSQISALADVGGVSTRASLTAPDLPSLRLVDPDLSNWQGQIIYLNFDGRQNVTYRGLVTVGPFDVPAFSLEGTALAGQEGAIITEVVARLQQTFAGSGVIFTTEQLEDGTPCSTIWIGGDDAAFSAYGSFFGLAEQVDVGNAILTDAGFVFSDESLSPSAGADDFAGQLSRTIAHEAGHLLGYAHDVPPDQPLPGGSALSQVALPEITVLGNGVSIADGDTTPSATDHTDFGSVGQGGTPLSRTFTVRNDGTSTLTLGTVTVPTGYTLTEALFDSLAPGVSDTFTVRLDTAIAGTKAGDISFSNDDSDENPFNFRIMGIVSLPLAEQFTGGSDSFDLANKAVLFTPNGSGYTFTIRSITALPTSPGGATPLTLSDDDAVQVTLDSGKTVVLYGQGYGSFHIGSNGYITFTVADTSYQETLTAHFSTPRVSVLFDDLNPSAGGQIGWQELSDRVVVTWDQVTDYGTVGPCTLQAAMYFDGRIELAWLSVASPDGIVGLSNGLGLPTGFAQTDFSSGGVVPPEITVLGNGVSIANGSTTPGPADYTDFGSIVLDGTAAYRTFTVRNDGGSTLTLDAVSVPTGFTLTEGLSASLAPGASDTFTVQLDTDPVGAKSGDITFSTNDADENPFHFQIAGLVVAVAAPEITVSGNGIAIADGDTTPSAVDHTDFGSVDQGGAALSRTFTVRNDGTATLTLEAVTIPAGYTLMEPLTSSLAPGASDTFTVRLDTATAGTKSGDVSFSNNDSDESPFNFQITGAVLAPEITVVGNGLSIADGDTTPSAGDYTDYGSVAYGGAGLSRTFTVRNDGTGTLTLGTVTVPTGYTVTEPLAGSLAPGASDTFTVRLNTATAGTKSGDLSFSNNDSDENPFNFRITGVVSLPLAEQFTGGADSFDLVNKAVLFTPDGSAYTFWLRSITELPTSPAGGTRLILGDDDAVQVTLGAGQTVALHGVAAGSFYVGSNGYITWGEPDTSYWETLAGHFAMWRISALYDDLNPTAGGQIGWQQLSDRAVVTWEQVREDDTGNGCTFQITMYFDGRIELAWLAVASPDGIVGLSNGSDLPDGFTETDFSKGLPGPPEITVQGNGVSIANGDTTPSSDDHTDFGTVVQGGEPITRVFTVRNDGLSTLTLGTVTVPTGFTLWETLSTSLAPGVSDTFTVWLDTDVAGTKTGEISFATNDSDENPFHFQITGTVRLGPEVTVLGNGVSIANGDTTPGLGDHTDFGSVVLDGTAAYRTFTVRNDGGSTLTLGAVSVPTGFTLTEPLSASLAPGASDTFTVQLDTDPVGVKSGDITFSTNDADENPFHFWIAGAVVLVAAPEMEVLGNGIPIASGDTTASLVDGTDFGTTDIGRTLTRTYTIDNRGLATLYLTGSPQITLSGSRDFSVAVQPEATVAAGGTTTFQIQFRPSGAGTQTATISIANNDGDENPYTFTIQGAGVAWDFVFFDDFDDGNFAGWSAVDPLTGAPATAPNVVPSPQGWALRGIGSGYEQDPALNVVLTRDLSTVNLGEMKIEMRAKAGPDRPNAVQVQLSNGGNYYTVVDYALDGWDLNDRANWNSWVDGAGQQLSHTVSGAPGEWHDFAWVRDAQGQWSLSIDGQVQAVNIWTDNQLRSFTKVAISLLRDQSEIEWIALTGNTLQPRALAMPVYRFWSNTTAHHFYTIREREKDKLITNFPVAWTYEGIAFYAFPNGDQTGTVPMYRFWSPKDNLHLFTIDKAERDRILATYPAETWTYEGVAFYIYPVASHPADTGAVYRFRSGRTNMYFFTMSTVERDYIRAHYPTTTWAYEDEAWYAFSV